MAANKKVCEAFDHFQLHEEFGSEGGAKDWVVEKLHLSCPQIELFNLTVVVSGQEGDVFVGPYTCYHPGGDDTTICVYFFPVGEEVMLAAAPVGDATVVWGGCSEEDGVCWIAMPPNNGTVVTATFEDGGTGGSCTNTCTIKTDNYPQGVSFGSGSLSDSPVINAYSRPYFISAPQVILQIDRDATVRASFSPIYSDSDDTSNTQRVHSWQETVHRYSVGGGMEQLLGDNGTVSVGRNVELKYRLDLTNVPVFEKFDIPGQSSPVHFSASAIGCPSIEWDVWVAYLNSSRLPGKINE
jgi:hypothetical protein